MLRRVDWRFLLPDPSPAKSVCFAPSLIAPLRLVFRQVDPEPASPVEGQYDLAVALDPDQNTLRAAAAALRPGGVCYTEWRSVARGRRRAVVRRLGRAGFDEVTCYRTWGDPSRSGARMWLPMGLRVAIPPPRPAPAPGPIQKLRRFAGNLRGALLPRRPVCAVSIRKGAEPPSTSVVTSRPLADFRQGIAVETARGRWTRWGLGEPPLTLRQVLLTGGDRAESKVVSMVFAEGRRRPEVVFKMSRESEGRAGLSREAEILSRLASSSSRSVEGIPRLFEFFAESGVVAETAILGRPVASLLSNRSADPLARMGARWLTELAIATRGGFFDARGLADDALARFEARYGAVLDPGLVRETEKILGGLERVPGVCQHSDFAPWNLVLDRNGRLHVLDWESAELPGLPVVDLVYWLAYVRMDTDRGAGPRRSDSIRAILDPKTRWGALYEESLTKYAETVGVPQAALRALRLLVWLLHSGSDYLRIVRDEGPCPPPEVLRRNLFVQLWEQDVRLGSTIPLES